MPENSLWSESTKSWCPKSYKESWRTGLESTPQCDLYEDESQEEQLFHQLTEKLETIPEVGDNYMGANIMLFRGNEM